MSLAHNVVKPLLVAAMAMCFAHCHIGCKSASTAVSNQPPQVVYQEALLACVEKSPTRYDSCMCRLAVDEQFHMCDHPDWPSVGRCDYVCEKYKTDAGMDVQLYQQLLMEELKNRDAAPLPQDAGNGG